MTAATSLSGAQSWRNHFMRRGKIATRTLPSPTSANTNDGVTTKQRRGQPHPGKEPVAGLRERKKARLRQQIVETALHLFRQRGYENTRIDDIVHTLEISQPTFFRYFPSKDAVLREVGRRAFARQAESLRSELSTKATTEQRLRRFYETLGNTTEVGRPLWQAVILAGAMDPVRSPELRGAEAATVSLLRQIIAEGQKNGEVTRDFPVVHLAEFMEGLFNTVVRQWAVDLTGPHKLTERVRNAVEFFLRGAKP
jgi:TetR/AcrR family transcriptional regulator, cholesterol catabolism regulator